MTLPIRRVDRRRAEQFEQLGSKPKFWFYDGQKRLLFKGDNRGTGEDWAEVIAFRLCRLLGLPHVEYELATEWDGEQEIRPGVVCENMALESGALILGNQLLLAFDRDYPSEKRFKVAQHTVTTVRGIVSRLDPPERRWMKEAPEGIVTAMDAFVGYVLLDVWIANQDRHHENWGAIGTTAGDASSLSLAPTFDHGAGLARNLQDKERLDRLTTTDKGRSLATFAARGRSAFYGDLKDRRPLLLRDAFRAFAEHARPATRIWIDRLQSVTRNDVLSIIEEIPAHRMSATSREFTLKLLEINRQRLLDSEMHQ